MLFESIWQENQRFLKVNIANGLIGSYLNNDKWSNPFIIYQKQIAAFDTKIWHDTLYCLIKTKNGDFEVITKNQRWEKQPVAGPAVQNSDPCLIKLFESDGGLFAVFVMHTKTHPVIMKKRLDEKDMSPDLIYEVAGPFAADIWQTDKQAWLIYSSPSGGVSICKADMLSNTFSPKASYFYGADIKQLALYEDDQSIYFVFCASNRIFLNKADSKTLVLKKTYDVAPAPQQWLLLPGRLLLLTGNLLTNVDIDTLKITKEEISGQNLLLGTVKINASEVCPAVKKDSHAPTLV